MHIPLESLPPLGFHPTQEADSFYSLLSTFSLRQETTLHKGRILRACRTFQPGDLLLLENAIAFATSPLPSDPWPSSLPPPSTSLHDFLFNLHLALRIAHQGLAAQTIAFQMHDAFAHQNPSYTELLRQASALGYPLPSTLPLSKIADLLGICRSNAFLQDDDPSGQDTLLLFPLAARISHACLSNSRFDIQGHKIAFYATQPILEGEEITHTYIPPHEPPPLYRQTLYDLFGFWCQCSTCAPSP